MRVQGKGESQAEIDSGCGWKGQRRKETEKKVLATGWHGRRRHGGKETQDKEVRMEEERRQG